jgi:hypothetical protein
MIQASKQVNAKCNEDPKIFEDLGSAMRDDVSDILLRSK